MAQLVLSTIGRAIGARVAPQAFRAIGAALGEVGGAALGRSIDQQIFGETRRFEGARLTDLHLQGSTEGASIPIVFGSVRIAGQVIWAARFKETSQTVESGGKGGGPRVTTTTYAYSLSFAVGLCEGEIARIGRVWANGEPFDLSEATWRLYTGSETQTVDALIEAIEGAQNAPAYRGLAYIVFEDLPLARFGNVMPQLSFEVIRAPRAIQGARIEERVRGVCLIPGSGEFVYATSPVRRVIGPGAEVAENVHAQSEYANLLVALDQLKADLPNCTSVMLVTSWFGLDLRCGQCAIMPGVELAQKTTTPVVWRAGGVDRSGAHVVSQVGGAPAFGGTPSDQTVIDAIAELKARGYKVGLYPFIHMDIPAGNGLPDPYGGAEQGAYPWRGRISVDPALGVVGSADKSAAAAGQIANFFGAAQASDFSIGANGVDYAGPAEWSFRRFILHCAKLAEAAGGVDAFVIGSELVNLTRVRDDSGAFPAVAALRSLASDVRTLVGMQTTLTYGADWSEYFGHQPQDGSGDVLFHLDPLWADSTIDVVGVDWYAPLTDWREGKTHADAQIARDIYDLGYLEGRIEAGEAYDWHYASDSDRASQIRSTISDGAYGEPWVYRAKDIRNFWARSHHERHGGVRSVSPTAWVAQSKPVWFLEIGIPAVNKGANAPNLFIDDKSSESALPPFSTGARDDLVQRRALDAYLSYWDEAGVNNPISTVYGGPMLDMDAMFVWCWDARPYPAFPAREDVWSDGANWRAGHWLNGRAGLAGLGEVVAELCARAGLGAIDVGALNGAVSGYVVDAPTSARSALEPLMAAYAFDARERDGLLVFAHRGDAAALALSLDDFTAESAGETFALRADARDAPIEARTRFIDAGLDYRVAAVSARRLDTASGGVVTIDAPLVLESQAAEAISMRVLAERRAQAETVSFAVGPALLALEPGDLVSFPWAPNSAFEITHIEDAEARRVSARRAAEASAGLYTLATPAPAPGAGAAPSPAFSILDLPLLPGEEDDERPLAGVFASPWLGAHAIYLGADSASLSKRADAAAPAIMGELIDDLPAGPTGRWDEASRARVRLYGGALASVSEAAVLDGANAFAVEGAGGAWEILQARNAVLVGAGEYELSGLLRGQQGSEQAIGAPALAGSRIVKLDSRLVRLTVGANEWGQSLHAAAPPWGALATDSRASVLSPLLAHAAARPYAPAHLRASRAPSGDITITWVRRARAGGDAWGAGEPPIEGPTEAYLIEILDNFGDVLRSASVSAPHYLYGASEQLIDFGVLPSAVRARVAMLDSGGAAGLKSELTLTL